MSEDNLTIGLDKLKLITAISMLCRALENILKNIGTKHNAGLAGIDGAELTWQALGVAPEY